MPTASSILDPIRPERALICLPLRDQYDEIYGNELITDFDMSAPTTADWGAVNSAVLSKVAGGYGGSPYFLRIGYGGSSNPTANQSVAGIVSSHRYRINYWYSVDSSAQARFYFQSPAQLLLLDPITPRAKWTNLKMDITSTTNGGAQFNNTTGAGGFYLDMGYASVKEIRRVTKNLGQATGAPTTVQCGDGFTSAYFPTQIVKTRGCNFSTQFFQILNSGAGSVFDLIGFQSFTCAALIYPTSLVGSRTIFSHASNTHALGWWVGFNAGKFEAGIAGTGNAVATTSIGAVITNKWQFVAAVFDGPKAQIRLYVDKSLVGTIGQYPTAGGVSYNTTFGIGYDYVGGSNVYAGAIKSPYIYPSVIGDAQLMALRAEMFETAGMR